MKNKPVVNDILDIALVVRDTYGPWSTMTRPEGAEHWIACVRAATQMWAEIQKAHRKKGFDPIIGPDQPPVSPDILAEVKLALSSFEKKQQLLESRIDRVERYGGGVQD